VLLERRVKWSQTTTQRCCCHHATPHHEVPVGAMSPCAIASSEWKWHAIIGISAWSLCLWLQQRQWLVRQRVVPVRSRLLLALKVIAVIENQKSSEKSSIFDRKNVRTTLCNPYHSMPSPWLDTTDFRLIVGSTSSEKHLYSLCTSVLICFQVFFVETKAE